MNKNSLTKLSVEELIQKEKTAKLLTGILIGVLTVLVIICIWLTTKNGFTAFTVLPIAFLPMVIINFSQIKSIKTELESRK